LKRAYDRRAERRDQDTAARWKQEQLDRFLGLLRSEGRRNLVDLGCGTGQHALFFQEQGLAVTCIDLSPENVGKCLARGLDARLLDIVDVGSLGIEFEAAFSMNSLLHMPRAELPGALRAIRLSLVPGGVFYWGQYGGLDREGIYDEDTYEPKRFFSLMLDDQIIAAAEREFTLVSFNRVDLEDEGQLHYQALILRARGSARRGEQAIQP